MPSRALRRRWTLGVENGIDPDNVAAIHIGTHKVAYELTGIIKEPKNSGEAKFSLAYGSAVALREHGFGVANLMEQSYTNPETLKLADRVTCEIDPDVQALFPQKRGAKVRIELKDGTVYEKELYDLKGSPNNPVSTEELKRKFMSNAKAAMPEERAERLLVLLAELEQFERVDALVELLG